MRNRIILMSVFLIFGCQTLLEHTTPLEGSFYLQDGWLEFKSDNYDKAGKHFNTAIETNENDSVIHFLSFVGLGWSKMYKAQSLKEVKDGGLVKEAGTQFDLAYSLIRNLDSTVMSSEIQSDYILGKLDMYAGVSIQRAYHAHQKAANISNWESINLFLEDSVINLFKASIEFGRNLQSDYFFQHDSTVVFRDLLTLRIENYIILGDLPAAVEEFKLIDFTLLNFEMSSECSSYIGVENIIGCTCTIVNNGACPFGE